MPLMLWVTIFMVWTTRSIWCGQHEIHMLWRICCGQHRMYMVWTTTMSSTAYRSCVPQHKKCNPRYITHSIYGYVVDNIEWVYTVEHIVYMVWVYTAGLLMNMVWVYTVDYLIYDVDIYRGLPNLYDVGIEYSIPNLSV